MWHHGYCVCKSPRAADVCVLALVVPRASRRWEAEQSCQPGAPLVGNKQGAVALLARFRIPLLTHGFSVCFLQESRDEVTAR